jgi:tRNA A-37 threonylcarbamoyl transferase component Bud32
VDTVQVNGSGARFRGKSGLGELDSEKLVTGLLGLSPGRFLRRVPNRETFVVDLSDLAAPRAVDGTSPAEISALAAANPDSRLAVLKRFRGGEPRDAWFEVLHSAVERSPARREAENLAGLAAASVPVPRALGYWESVPRGLGRPGKRFGSSMLLMEYVPHTETLRDVVWAGGGRGGLLLGKLAPLVGAMHGAGWYHRDLYMEHVILGPGGLCLLDAGRARHQERPLARWFAKDLAALWTSRAPGMDKRANMLFLARWGEAFGMATQGRPLRGSELRKWLGPIQKRGQRIQAHAPRHSHSDS